MITNGQVVNEKSVAIPDLGSIRHELALGLASIRTAWMLARQSSPPSTDDQDIGDFYDEGVRRITDALGAMDKALEESGIEVKP